MHDYTCVAEVVKKYNHLHQFLFKFMNFTAHKVFPATWLPFCLSLLHAFFQSSPIHVSNRIRMPEDTTFFSYLGKWQPEPLSHLPPVPVNLAWAPNPLLVATQIFSFFNVCHDFKMLGETVLSDSSYVILLISPVSSFPSSFLIDEYSSLHIDNNWVNWKKTYNCLSPHLPSYLFSYF